MAGPHQEHTLKPTTTDLELSLAFFAVLVDQAKAGSTITYGELVTKAKARFPTNGIVQNAIAVSAGRRLDFVRDFARERDLPDLTSLVISKSTGECGVGFTRNYDPARARAMVSAFDWSSVSSEFSVRVAAAIERAKPRKKLNEAQARQVMSQYYFANKSILPTDTPQHRDRLIKLLMSGLSAEVAFAKVERGDA